MTDNINLKRSDMIKKGLTSDQLKNIAISAMLLDHIAAAFISHETIWGMALRRVTAIIRTVVLTGIFPPVHC